MRSFSAALALLSACTFLNHDAAAQEASDLITRAKLQRGICCVLGTAGAFFAARRQYLIAPIMLCLGLGLWLILCISIGFMWLTRTEPGLSSVVLAMGLLALPVAPLATAPLALAWNRHR